MGELGEVLGKLLGELFEKLFSRLELGELFDKLFSKLELWEPSTKFFSRLAQIAFSQNGVIGFVSVLVAFFILLFFAKFIRYAVKKRYKFWVWFQMLVSVVRSSQMKSETIHSGVCATVLLIAAFSSWPYFMYVLLRVFICVSSAYIASRLHSQHRVPLTWLFGAIALLYNPILPVKMARSDWEVINVFTAIIFIGFSVYLNWNTLLRRPGAPSIS